MSQSALSASDTTSHIGLFLYLLLGGICRARINKINPKRENHMIRISLGEVAATAVCIMCTTIFFIKENGMPNSFKVYKTKYSSEF